jgi:hypothetical protein
VHAARACDAVGRGSGKRWKLESRFLCLRSHALGVKPARRSSSTGVDRNQDHDRRDEGHGVTLCRG